MRWCAFRAYRDRSDGRLRGPGLVEYMHSNAGGECGSEAFACALPGRREPRHERSRCFPPQVAMPPFKPASGSSHDGVPLVPGVDRWISLSYHHFARRMPHAAKRAPASACGMRGRERYSMDRGIREPLWRPCSRGRCLGPAPVRRDGYRRLAGVGTAATGRGTESTTCPFAGRERSPDC